MGSRKTHHNVFSTVEGGLYSSGAGRFTVQHVHVDHLGWFNCRREVENPY